MKSEFADRETLGSQMTKTQRAHENSISIEANDLSHEMGNSYMRELRETIEKHQFLKSPYYIQVISSRDVIWGRRALVFRFFARLSKPLMEDDMDLWYIDNKKNIIKLMWSLPHWSEFDMILRDESHEDKKVVDWIHLYKSMQKK